MGEKEKGQSGQIEVLLPKAGDFCNICWVESLQMAPCCRLDCGHVFHHHCLTEKLQNAWPGARISFGYLNCPLCKVRISHPSLKPVLGPALRVLRKVKS